MKYISHIFLSIKMFIGKGDPKIIQLLACCAGLYFCIITYENWTNIEESYTFLKFSHEYKHNPANKYSCNYSLDLYNESNSVKHNITFLGNDYYYPEDTIFLDFCQTVYRDDHRFDLSFNHSKDEVLDSGKRILAKQNKYSIQGDKIREEINILPKSPEKIRDKRFVVNRVEAHSSVLNIGHEQNSNLRVFLRNGDLSKDIHNIQFSLPYTDSISQISINYLRPAQTYSIIPAPDVMNANLIEFTSKDKLKYISEHGITFSSSCFEMGRLQDFRMTILSMLFSILFSLTLTIAFKITKKTFTNWPVKAFTVLAGITIFALWFYYRHDIICLKKYSRYIIPYSLLGIYVTFCVIKGYKNVWNKNTPLRKQKELFSFLFKITIKGIVIAAIIEAGFWVHYLVERIFFIF